MNSLRIKLSILVGCLIAASLAALALAGTERTTVATTTDPVQASGADAILSLKASLTQDKIFINSDGRVGLSLTMTAADLPSASDTGDRGVDMVIVLDRSGSMQADKLDYAKKAMLRLLAQLSEGDRLAIVSYSDNVVTHSHLLNVTPSHRAMFLDIIGRIQAGGNTNLGAGLQQGLDILARSGDGSPSHNVGRLVLISDGLANEGVTDPDSLGRMASRAVSGEFAVSTVGVGLDFDEHLMSRIADMGTGRYYYLAEPAQFADTFISEFRAAKTVAAASLEVRLPLPEGAYLEEAGGFPVTVEDGVAVFHPGDLLSGQSRRIYLTLRMPVSEADILALSGLSVRYLHDGSSRSVALANPLNLAVVEDEREALSSIDGEEWKDKVLQEDYNRMREDVAAAVSRGDMDEALGRIEEYKQEAETINAVVNSPEVTANLESDVIELRDQVTESFAGADASDNAVRQQIFAKEQQQEGYNSRRDY